MTFWTDAKPATPRFRLRRHHRPEPRPGGSWRPRRGVIPLALLIVAVAVAVGLVVARAGDGPASTAAASPPRPAAPSSPIPVIVPTWSATLAWGDYPQQILTDSGPDAIVIGDLGVTQLDIDDGDSHWRTRTPRLTGFAAMRGDTIVISTKVGFAAMDRATGEARWQTNTPETPGAVAIVGPKGTPAVVMISTEEGGLVGLDSRTGTARWSKRFPGSIAGIPAPDDRTGLVATVWWEAGAARLRMIDASTGDVRWQQELPHLASSPLITTGPGGRRRVVVGAGSGDFESEVRSYDFATGELRWASPVPGSFQPWLLPLADGQDLYVLDQLSHVTRLDLATGRRRWSTDTHSIATDGSPVRAGDSILVTGLSYDVTTLDRTNGAIRAQRRTVGFPTQVRVAHGRVLIAERLKAEHQIQAFPARVIAKSLPAPARKPG